MVVSEEFVELVGAADELRNDLFALPCEFVGAIEAARVVDRANSDARQIRNRAQGRRVKYAFARHFN